MWDPAYLFALYAVVPAVHWDMALCYGTLYCIPPALVPDLTCPTDLETVWDLLQEGP